MKLAKWFVFLLVGVLCVLTVAGASWLQRYRQLTDDETTVVLSPDIAEITYCTIDATPLKMDLYLPQDTPAPYPALVYFHGGSFTGGDKRKGSGVTDIPAMTGRGYAVAAVNYRLMPENPFPAAVIDAKCAVRYLRAHREAYGLLTEKIGVWGGSAGGHLAAMMGLTNGDPAFEAGEHLEFSSRVDAVVEMFGPSDLTQPMGWLQRLLLRRAFGADSPGDERLIAASPVRYLAAGAPPFLILHGELDRAVPVEQAEILYRHLDDAGIDVTLLLVKNADHNFKPTGGVIEPSRGEISDLMADFFDRTLH